MLIDNTKLKFAEALEEMLQDKPLAKITIADLCEKSGLSRQTFYRHFSDIYDLVNFTHEYLGRLAVMVFDETLNLEESIAWSLSIFQKHITFYRYISKDNSPNSFPSHFCQSIQDAQIKHIGRENMDEEDFLLLRMYATGATVVMMDWIQGKVNCPAKTLARYISHSYPQRLMRHYKKK